MNQTDTIPAAGQGGVRKKVFGILAWVGIFFTAYWVNRWVIDRTVEAECAKRMTWAVDQGYFIVNTQLVAEAIREIDKAEE